MSVKLYSIIVPAHNESENLVILLPRLDAALQKLSREYEIIVVNNASTDDTEVAIDGLGLSRVRIAREPALGYGRAVLAGLSESRGDMIGIIRADNQEKPDDLRAMFDAAEREGVALYKAVRKNRISDGLKRIIISFVYNMLFKFMFGLSSRDLNATPKVFTRSFLEQARLESKDWFIDAEMVIKAEHLGLSIREMEIEYLPRLKGKSTVRMRHIFEFLGNMLRWYLSTRHGRLLEK
ncbi:MAG TPA: glycosyltransferase family 2 protein [Candidatus Paceibacterota bacterium]